MTLPFNMPSTDVLFASPKRVLSHYFYPFPLQIDNVAASVDYYNRNYLVPSGEGGKFSAQGGYLRSRPMQMPVNSSTNYVELNMQTEIKMAIARGITGFTFDILSLTDAANHLQLLLTAAQTVDPRFWIVPMLDMSALASITHDQAVALIASFSHPSFAKFPDGRLLISAFDATLQTLAWWQSVIATLNAQNVDIAFIPILLGEPATNPLAAVSHGLGGWGTATPSAAATCPPCMMMPVLPQQFRPKDHIFWEAVNTSTFRASWTAAINSNAQFVQIVTWSDFSESGQVQPFTDATLATNIGTGFYDLNAYYATWFLTHVQPVITKDVLYWCHRRMSSSAAHINQANSVSAIGPPEENSIELLAFLTDPGMLVINGQTLSAPAGITSFRVPQTPGNPVFALQRDGSDVMRFTSPVQIYGPAGIPSGVIDMTYWTGSFTKAGGLV